MKLRQRFYLVEVLSGLGLTAAHFFGNMGRHIARALGRKNARGADSGAGACASSVTFVRFRLDGVSSGWMSLKS